MVTSIQPVAEVTSASEPNKPTDDTKQEKPTDDAKLEKSPSVVTSIQPVTEVTSAAEPNKPTDDTKQEKPTDNTKQEKPTEDAKLGKSPSLDTSIQPVTEVTSAAEPNKPTNDTKEGKPADDATVEKTPSLDTSIQSVTEVTSRAEQDKPTDDRKLEKIPSIDTNIQALFQTEVTKERSKAAGDSLLVVSQSIVADVDGTTEITTTAEYTDKKSIDDAKLDQLQGNDVGIESTSENTIESEVQKVPVVGTGSAELAGINTGEQREEPERSILRKMASLDVPTGRVTEPDITAQEEEPEEGGSDKIPSPNITTESVIERSIAEEKKEDSEGIVLPRIPSLDMTSDSMTGSSLPENKQESDESRSKITSPFNAAADTVTQANITEDKKESDKTILPKIPSLDITTDTTDEAITTQLTEKPDENLLATMPPLETQDREDTTLPKVPSVDVTTETSAETTTIQDKNESEERISPKSLPLDTNNEKQEIEQGALTKIPSLDLTNETVTEAKNTSENDKPITTEDDDAQTTTENLPQSVIDAIVDSIQNGDTLNNTDKSIEKMIDLNRPVPESIVSDIALERVPEVTQKQLGTHEESKPIQADVLPDSVVDAIRDITEDSNESIKQDTENTENGINETDQDVPFKTNNVLPESVIETIHAITGSDDTTKNTNNDTLNEQISTSSSSAIPESVKDVIHDLTDDEQRPEGEQKVAQKDTTSSSVLPATQSTVNNDVERPDENISTSDATIHETTNQKPIHPDQIAIIIEETAEITESESEETESPTFEIIQEIPERKGLRASDNYHSTNVTQDYKDNGKMVSTIPQDTLETKPVGQINEKLNETEELDNNDQSDSSTEDLRSWLNDHLESLSETNQANINQETTQPSKVDITTDLPRTANNINKSTDQPITDNLTSVETSIIPELTSPLDTDETIPAEDKNTDEDQDDPISITPLQQAPISGNTQDNEDLAASRADDTDSMDKLTENTTKTDDVTSNENSKFTDDDLESWFNDTLEKLTVPDDVNVSTTTDDNNKSLNQPLTSETTSVTPEVTGRLDTDEPIPAEDKNMDEDQDDPISITPIQQASIADNSKDNEEQLTSLKNDTDSSDKVTENILKGDEITKDDNYNSTNDDLKSWLNDIFEKLTVPDDVNVFTTSDDNNTSLNQPLTSERTSIAPEVTSRLDTDETIPAEEKNMDEDQDDPISITPVQQTSISDKTKNNEEQLTSLKNDTDSSDKVTENILKGDEITEDDNYNSTNDDLKSWLNDIFEKLTVPDDINVSTTSDDNNTSLNQPLTNVLTLEETSVTPEATSRLDTDESIPTEDKNMDEEQDDPVSITPLQQAPTFGNTKDNEDLAASRADDTDSIDKVTENIPKGDEITKDDNYNSTNDDLKSWLNDIFEKLTVPDDVNVSTTSDDNNKSLGQPLTNVLTLDETSVTPEVTSRLDTDETIPTEDKNMEEDQDDPISITPVQQTSIPDDVKSSEQSQAVVHDNNDTIVKQNTVETEGQRPIANEILPAPVENKMRPSKYLIHQTALSDETGVEAENNKLVDDKTDDVTQIKQTTSTNEEAVTTDNLNVPDGSKIESTSTNLSQAETPEKQTKQDGISQNELTLSTIAPVQTDTKISEVHIYDDDDDFYDSYAELDVHSMNTTPKTPQSSFDVTVTPPSHTPEILTRAMDDRSETTKDHIYEAAHSQAGLTADRVLSYVINDIESILSDPNLLTRASDGSSMSESEDWHSAIHDDPAMEGRSIRSISTSTVTDDELANNEIQDDMDHTLPTTSEDNVTAYADILANKLLASALYPQIMVPNQAYMRRDESIESTVSSTLTMVEGNKLDETLDNITDTNQQSSSFDKNDIDYTVLEQSISTEGVPASTDSIKSDSIAINNDKNQLSSTTNRDNSNNK